MAKYVYPAVFAAESTGGYSVYFPDVEGCYTQGEDMAEAIEMAKDALCLMLYDMETDHKEIPAPTDIHNVKGESSSDIVSLVACDTMTYRRFYDKKAVKKTLSIPNWLNIMAEEQGINFSAVLQNALKEQLHIQ